MPGEYTDTTIIPSRDIGRERLEMTGIRAYTDPLPVLTGTFLTTPTEAEVVTGGQTIILTISQGKWIASGAVFNAVRQAIINGLDSAQSEAAGWNVEVRDKAAVTCVVRTSDTVVTVTLPATAGYSVAANETITFTLPREAVEGWPAAVGNVVITIVAA